MASGISTESLGFKCRICAKTVKTAQGLKSHVTRLHNGIPEDVVSSHNQDCLPTVQAPIDGQEEECDLADFLAAQKSTVKVLRRIPKGARTLAAEVMTECIDLCLRDNSEASWGRLMRFAGRCLKLPSEKSGADSNASLTTQVKRNIELFRQNICVPPKEEIQNFSHQKPGQKCTTRQGSREGENDRLLAKSVELKMADGDIVGAIRLLSSEDAFAAVDEESLEAIRAKHLSHTRSLDWPELTTHQENSVKISEPMVRAAMASFPAGSAGGLDLIRPQHIKDMIGFCTGAAGLRLLSSLSKLCLLMIKGEVPSAICPILYGASLCALKKKDGGIRPIAVGNTLRRLAAKLGSGFIMERLGKHFQPVQLGFGTRGGAEAATHAARRFFLFDHRETKVFLKIDFLNAFNSVNRDCLLNSAISLMPELGPFLFQCYRQPSHLFFGTNRIPSERGIQQGDPLGPALFCAVVHPMVSSLKSELNLWFLDDGALGGTPESVSSDLVTIMERSSSLGLELNLSKCELFCINAAPEEINEYRRTFENIAQGILFPEDDECILLGAPLKETACHKSLSSKTEALSRMADRLKNINAHAAYFILKNSQAIPKLTFVMRCSPTWKDVNSLSVFDKTLKMALESISNACLSDDAWQQSALPVALGGLGIKHASTVALPAFLSSVSNTEALVKVILPPDITMEDDPLLSEGICEWKRYTNGLNPDSINRCSQKEWEKPSIETSRLTLLQRAPTLQDKARLLGVASGESGAFLNAVPSPQLGTSLENNSFRIAVALRLGVPICQPHPCPCGALVDTSGTHGLNCKQSAGRWSRHSAVNDVLKRGLVSAGYPVVLEPSFLLRDNSKRPDGITQIPWAGGKSLVWDFTCTNSLAPSYLPMSSGVPLHAASIAEAKKREKYAQLEHSHHFFPIAAECLGSLGKASLKIVKDIGKRISENTGEKRASEYFLQRISVAIQRGNAASVMGTLPKDVSLEQFINLL